MDPGHLYLCRSGRHSEKAKKSGEEQVEIETGRGQGQVVKERLENKGYMSIKTTWQMATGMGVVHTVYQEGDETMNSRCAGGGV